MALRTEQKLPIILFVVFLTLSTIGILFYQSTSSLQEALVWERQTQEFHRLVDQTTSFGINLDRDVLGFLMTNSDTYLDQFNRATRQTPQNFAEMRKLSADDPESLEVIDRFEAAFKALLADAQTRIDYRKMEGPQKGYESVTNIKYRPLLDQVRAVSDELKALESQKLEAREKGLDSGLYRTVWILILSSLAGIVALTLANFVVYREIKKRQRAETELIDTNYGLERRIEIRTAELKNMNAKLLEVGGERELSLKNEKRARHEAEIANRLRDEFMATVSHELRTPLNSILGWARLLKDGTLDNDLSERAVATIIKNSETQNRLIEDLLDVARLISGKLELDKVTVDLNDALKESIEISRPSAEAKSLSIEFVADRSNESVNVSGDPNRLRQVFANLLTNAIKFSHEHGHIDVRLSTEKGSARIDVIDSGMGISSEFLPKVFERFRQDSSLRGKNGGLGLGLAIVRNLVELHGGEVGVESEGENKGATFTVRLPLIEN